MMMLCRFTLPELKVGTLDSLMVLSDDLVKVNSMLEAVVNKIRRQLFEMQAASSSSDDSSGEVLVENMPPDAYIEKFKWNEAKYPPRRPLSETVHTITETVSKLEEDLKVLAKHAHQQFSLCMFLTGFVAKAEVQDQKVIPGSVLPVALQIC